MKPAMLIQIVLRLISIYLLFQALMVLIVMLPMLSEFCVSDWDNLRVGGGWFVLVVSLIPLVLAVFFWKKPTSIARVILGKQTEGVTNEPLTAQGLTGVGIAVCGLVILTTNLPGFVFMLCHYEPFDPFSDSDFYRNALITQGIRIFMALTLLVGARYWVRLINYFRDCDTENNKRQVTQVRGSNE